MTCADACGMKNELPAWSAPPGYFPAPEQDETIFSVCARLHRLRGGAPAQTCTRLGLRGGHTHPSVPAGLERMQSLSRGLIGADEATLRSRTVLRAFLPLMPHERRIATIAACRSNAGAATATARAGLNRYTHSRSLLKFCPICAAMDDERVGVAYWRTSHQLPGAWICVEHGMVLRYVEHQTRRSGWLLPCDVPPAVPQVTVSGQLKLLGLQRVIEWLCGQYKVEPVHLQIMLRQRLRRAGLCRSELKWHQAEVDHLARLAADYCSDLDVPDIRQLNATDWLTPLFHESRHYDPLTWALAMSWTGDTRPDLLAAEYQAAAARKPQADLFDSYSRVCRRTSAPEDLYRAFAHADRKAEAVSASGLSEFEVDSWLRRDSGLKPFWESQRRRARRLSAEEEVRAYLLDNPGARRVDVLRGVPSAFRWLERHDRSLLEGLLPPPIDGFARQRSLTF